MNDEKLSQYIEDSLVSLLADLDKKFKGNKKSASLIEKQIIQLLISQVVKDAHFHDNCLFFHLPFSGEIAWIDLSWPIDLDPAIKNQINRTIKNIEGKMKAPERYNWNNEIKKDLKIFTAHEVFLLHHLGRINPSVWKLVEGNMHLLYRKDQEYVITQSQFYFKMYCLLKYREIHKKKTQEEVLSSSSGLLTYKESKKLFNEKEKKEFQKKTLEQHYMQPGLVKIKGTALEGLLNDSLLFSHKDYTIFYEEESHRQGYDLEVITPSMKSVRISSKTGNFVKAGVIHISSSRTQKMVTLKEKIDKINSELDSISMITACVSVIEGNRKKYIRLALDPKKLKVYNKRVFWETQNPKNKDKSHGWSKYSYTTDKFSLTITEGKSHQVDFYIPVKMFDVIDEFYIE